MMKPSFLVEINFVLKFFEDHSPKFFFSIISYYANSVPTNGVVRHVTQKTSALDSVVFGSCSVRVRFVFGSCPFVCHIRAARLRPSLPKL